MRVLCIVILTILIGGAVLSAATGRVARAQDESGAGPAEPTSYAVGHALGSRTRTGLSNDGMGVDVDLVAKGFADALNGQDPMVPRREMRGIRAAVHREMEARRVRRLLADSPEFKKLYDGNLERGKKFRDLFAKQPGVVELPHGALYAVVQSAQGRSPGPDDTVVVKVRAMKLDKSVINDGQTPFDVEVGGTIPGGTEILQLMSVGTTWQVILPPDLAYGEGGRHPDIGPNETLALTVELVEIKQGGGRNR